MAAESAISNVAPESAPVTTRSATCNPSPTAAPAAASATA